MQATQPLTARIKERKNNDSEWNGHLVMSTNHHHNTGSGDLHTQYLKWAEPLPLPQGVTDSHRHWQRRDNRRVVFSTLPGLPQQPYPPSLQSPLHVHAVARRSAPRGRWNGPSSGFEEPPAHRARPTSSPPSSRRFTAPTLGSTRGKEQHRNYPGQGFRWVYPCGTGSPDQTQDRRVTLDEIVWSGHCPEEITAHPMSIRLRLEPTGQVIPHARGQPSPVRPAT